VAGGCADFSSPGRVAIRCCKGTGPRGRARRLVGARQKPCASRAFCRAADGTRPRDIQLGRVKPARSSAYWRDRKRRNSVDLGSAPFAPLPTVVQHGATTVVSFPADRPGFDPSTAARVLRLPARRFGSAPGAARGHGESDAGRERCRARRGRRGVLGLRQCVSPPSLCRRPRPPRPLPCPHRQLPCPPLRRYRRPCAHGHQTACSACTRPGLDVSERSPQVSLSAAAGRRGNVPHPAGLV
jgi:hypothetical protein